MVVFALSKDDGSAERRDIQASADHFVLLEPDHPSPRLDMQTWSCDVLIYLDGYVMRARPDLFARRSDGSGGVAPLQVACMYPSTLGTADFDYRKYSITKQPICSLCFRDPV